jgi:hypothetical protein
MAARYRFAVLIRSAPCEILVLAPLEYGVVMIDEEVRLRRFA